MSRPNLSTCDDPFLLAELAARVRASSNFRFNWQFYRCGAIDLRSAQDVRRALDAIIATPELHRFLRDSFQPMYDDAFEIEPLHEHCQLAPAAGEFENVLAAAAGDHMGAYSPELRDATAAERQEIAELFGSAGTCQPYSLVPGSVPGCQKCRDYNNHVFSTWFYCVAWDYCLLAAWPERDLLWVGCLTDTD